MPNPHYHSALDTAVAVEPMERFEYGGNSAFVWDIMDGALPPEYAECDCFYSDIAWTQGFKKFNKRARIQEERDFKEYMTKVNRLVYELDAPAVMVTGKHAKRYLPLTERMVPIFLNGPEVVAYCYNFENTPPSHLDAPDFIRWMAVDLGLERIGDFHAGYGRSGRIFQEEGKGWVLSDFNPMCVGMIARMAPTWGAKK